MPKAGVIFRREDSSIRCKYLVRGGEVKMANIIDIKKYWMRRDARYKIRFLDENNTARIIIVSMKMKCSNAQILRDILQPKES
jgi:hypothetical protein